MYTMNPILVREKTEERFVRDVGSEARFIVKSKKEATQILRRLKKNLHGKKDMHGNTYVGMQIVHSESMYGPEKSKQEHLF